MANSKRHPKSKRPARRGKAGSSTARPAATTPPIVPTSYSPEHTTHVRELFWNNVMREVLTALSQLSAAVERNASTKPEAAEELAAPLDGRMAVITSAGQRVPIADVYPLFACGIPGNADEKALSIAVECTVFQIVTPSGEVYTLPLHEIRGFHALSPELMKQLAEATRSEEGGSRTEPFGFAAFTSLAKGEGAGSSGRAAKGGEWMVD